MLDISKPDKIVLRLTTLLANVATAAKRMKIDPAYDLPSEYKAAAPDTMSDKKSYYDSFEDR